jgi:hypothetical protein
LSTPANGATTPSARSVRAASPARATTSEGSALVDRAVPDTNACLPALDATPIGASPRNDRSSMEAGRGSPARRAAADDAARPAAANRSGARSVDATVDMNVRRQCTARFQNVARVCAMNVAVFVFLLFFREEVRELTASRSGGASAFSAFSRVFVASCFFSVGSF